MESESPLPEKKPRMNRRRWIVLGVLVAVIILEVKTYAFQALFFSLAGRVMDYEVADGDSSFIIRAPDGPFDRRFGYSQLPDIEERLIAKNFEVERRARVSVPMLLASKTGFFVPFAEKSAARLTILDGSGRPLHEAPFPAGQYQSFKDIPAPVVRILLFIENRSLLDTGTPLRNPALEWERLGLAVLESLRAMLRKGDEDVVGGSTLATQIQKFRHSPGGRTGGPIDKARQMISASLKAYAGGMRTMPAREEILRDYLNAVPLAARPGVGEIHGLGEGLRWWYGVDPDEVNQLLRDDLTRSEKPVPAKHARAFNQVLSLCLAHRRPSHYLGAHPEALEAQTRTYIDLLEREGMLSAEFAKAARKAPVKLVRARHLDARASDAASAVKTELISLLGIQNEYDLERLDLTVETTLDGDLQEEVSDRLRRMSNADETSGVIYSLLLCERENDANVVRVEADNFRGPFNVNRGVKLDLGSTAKLRTLATYLELVAEMHAELVALTDADLRARAYAEEDKISTWAKEYLIEHPAAELETMLEAAVMREYQAHPHEEFFTGGAPHNFVNFSRGDDTAILAVRDGFHRSNNLVFIRIMRDITNWHIHRLPGASPDIVENPDAAGRKDWIERYISHEGPALARRYRSDASRLRPANSLQKWVVDYVKKNPEAEMAEFLWDAEEPIREYFKPLLSDRGIASQNAVRTALEREAFRGIHARWVRLGYPFSSLVPSYATAIGSSADRPSALAEIVSIISGHGERRPSYHLARITFARGTPYEVTFRPRRGATEKVMSRRVAAKLRELMIGVVERGTARPAAGLFRDSAGRILAIGGKTGTGDHRLQRHDAAGRLISEEVRNRSATFAFFIGSRYFGTVVAYVPGKRAAGYGFTSSTSVGILRDLAPELRSRLRKHDDPDGELTSDIIAAIGRSIRRYDPAAPVIEMDTGLVFDEADSQVSRTSYGPVNRQDEEDEEEADKKSETNDGNFY